MADRSYGSFLVPIAYADIAAAGLSGWDRDEDATVGSFSNSEVAGGGDNEAAWLRDHFVPFYWEYEGCPGSYDSGAAYYVPGVGYAEIIGHTPVVRVGPRGGVDRHDVKAATNFYKLKSAFGGLVRRSNSGS